MDFNDNLITDDKQIMQKMLEQLYLFIGIDKLHTV